MPTLVDVLANIPGYGAYIAKRQMNEQQPLREAQQVGAVLGVQQAMQQRAQEQELRQALAASGGDPERAMATLIQGGNVAGAAKLAPILEERRKAKAPRVVTPGSQVLGENNEVLYSAPFAPQRPTVVPPGSAVLPAGATEPTYSAPEKTTQPFGSGATGGALSLITRLAPNYGEGSLTEEQTRMFESALTHYTQPRAYQNPDTGIIEMRRPELPRFVQEAVSRRRGGSPRQPVPDGPSPTPGAEPASQSSGGGAPGPTVWSLAPLTTGPIPAAAEALSRTPVIGEVVRAPQMTQARNFVPLLQRDLVRVLQNNPRYAEGERRAIEQEININPAVIDTPAAFRDRLIGIDRALEIRERNAFETARSARVGREERVQAMNVLNALTKFRQNLGVPPRIKGDDDYNSLQPGTEYIDPEGQVRRKK